jgi:hypothetical protein
MTPQGGVDGLRAARPVLPIDRDESRGRDRPAQDGHPEHAPLGEEADLHWEVGEEHQDVAEALVVGDDHEAAAGLEPLGMKDLDADARHGEQCPRPTPREAEEPVASRRNQRREDRRNPEEHGRDRDDRPHDRRADGPHGRGF